jgi:hypothetical protein
MPNDAAAGVEKNWLASPKIVGILRGQVESAPSLAREFAGSRAFLV